jgi:hypothetical protein
VKPTDDELIAQWLDRKAEAFREAAHREIDRERGDKVDAIMERARLFVEVAELVRGGHWKP